MEASVSLSCVILLEKLTPEEESTGLSGEHVVGAGHEAGVVEDNLVVVGIDVSGWSFVPSHFCNLTAREGILHLLVDKLLQVGGDELVFRQRPLHGDVHRIGGMHRNAGSKRDVGTATESIRRSVFP